MPSHLHNKKSANDKFYTKPEIVDVCLEILKNSVCFENDYFVEPSAGDGRFYNKLPNNKIGYDIEPEGEFIIKKDWFEVVIDKPCVIVGNPPFGTRNKLTNDFIKHAAKYAKCIAFILPSVYMKESMQKIFGEDWFLETYLLLPKNSFTLENEEYHVPCVFQVWKNKKFYPCVNDLRESNKIKKTTDHFEFVKDGNYFIFGAAPSKIIDVSDVEVTNRGYVISCNSQVVDFLTSINWKEDGYSSVNGGVSWFGKQQIINVYLKNIDSSGHKYD